MGHQNVRLPYSQPWYKPQLEETLAELERCKRQVGKLSTALDAVAKERNAAIENGKRSTETISQLCDEAVVREKRKNKAIEETVALKAQVDQGEKDRKQLEAENARLRARVMTVTSEVEDLKASMSAYVEDRIRAERSAADSSVAAARAEAAAEQARNKATQVQKERDSALEEARAAKDAEERRLVAVQDEGAREERERRARLEAFVVPIKQPSRQAISDQSVALRNMEAEQRAALTSKYEQPEDIWSLLEPKSFGGQHDSPIVLLSANWLRTQRPRKLPERQKLPAEAVLPVRSLRTISASIEKGMAKGMARPLPIICVLMPHSALAPEGSVHPDPEGRHLELIVNALDYRWAEFTKRRGGTQSTGVTDLGVFVDWSSLYMAPQDPPPPGAKGAAAAKVRHTPHDHAVAHDLPSRDLTSHDLTSHDLTSRDLTSHDLTSHDLTSHDLTSHDLTSHDLTSHDLTSHDLTSHDLTSHDLTPPHPTSPHLASPRLTSPHLKVRRTPHEHAVFHDALAGVHTLFAHKLTTVWMIPEGQHTVGPKEVKYKEAWPSFLYLVATMIKPVNISEVGAWPQVLDLGGAVSTTAVPVPNGHYEQERICRRAPCEPLTFFDGHEHGHCIGSTPMVAAQYREALYAMLAGVEELDFRKCGWGDEEAAWMALAMPLCGRLQRLLLSGNAIGNTGASAIAGALASGACRNLVILALDNNEIGDAGASSLFQCLSPTDGSTETGGQRPLSELKTFTLANNSISDSSIAALAGAITVGALKGCKVNLDGNPATKVSRKAVKKALKKCKNMP